MEVLTKAQVSVTKATVEAKAKNDAAGTVGVYDHIGKRLNSATKTTGALAACAWVPPSLKTLCAGPENLGTFGTPWFLRSEPAVSRSLCNHIPLWGTGHFVCGIAEYAWLVSYPGQCILDLGEILEKGWEVTSALPKAEFQTFFAKNVFHTLVRPGSVAWIPYGHCPTIISLSGTEACDYLVMPYMSMPLVDAMIPAVRTAVLKTFQRFQHSAATKHDSWLTNGPAFVTWFQAGLEYDKATLADTGEDSSDDRD
jgi:hypothetical protein